MFLVIHESKDSIHSTPKKVHNTLHDAEIEAMRLASIHAGIKFYVASILMYAYAMPSPPPVAYIHTTFEQVEEI